MTIGLTEKEIRDLVTTPQFAQSLQVRFAQGETGMSISKAIEFALQASIETTVRLICANNTSIEIQLRDHGLIP